MSLGRLLVDRGEAQEARELVSEVCSRFTEGFETADLQNARAFVDQLAVPLRAISS